VSSRGKQNRLTDTKPASSAKSRRGWLIGGGLLAIIAIVVGVVWFSPWLVVKNIEVEGVVHGDKAGIIEASGISEGQRLAGLDTDAAARSVAGQPWVDSVTVSRSWPQGVNIEVKEFHPVLFIRATDGEHLISDQGQEFVTATPPEGVIEVVDVPRTDQPADGKIDPEPAVIKAVLDVVKALPEPIVGRIERVSAPSAAEVRLFLSDGYQVYFGSSDNAAEKARATEIVLSRGEKTWDVSNPRMPTTTKE
jgi:cell division protein FtsQ